MKAIAIVMTAAALVALGGCNKSGSGAANANGNSGGGSNAVAANSAAPKPGDSAGNQSASAGMTGSTVASSGPVQLDRAYMLGRWTDDGNCANAMEFAQDGTFRTSAGGTGLWNLEADQLTLSGGQTLAVRLTPIDRNTITVIHSDGSLGRSTRC